MTEHATIHQRHSKALVLALALAATLAACGAKEPKTNAAEAPASAAPAVEAAPASVAPAPAAPAAPAAIPTSWTPEALEELLAPIALYPDPVLSQVLIASTNPQEVLDSGNWLLQNTALKGKPLDEAAAQVGFTPPIRALVQFPETIDMLCLELAWTTELGQAFTADQAGVLDAVQRLRKQAQDVGNLKSSKQMKVETQVQEGKEVVVLKPAQPEVVFVPQYDPSAVYAPAPSVAPAASTVTTTSGTTSKGYSGGDLAMTGLLAFGAGMLVNEIFDDDDDRRGAYYYPNYGYGGMPYYPPYPYRPVYGNGFNPGHGYNRPPNYNSGFQNNGVINVNVGGNGSGNGYWDRYGNDRQRGGVGADGRRSDVRSPISAARPNRPELASLNQRQPRSMPADARRPAPTATAANWKGQSGYAGAQPGRKPASAADRIANATPAYSKPPAARPEPKKAAARDGARPAPKAAPKVQGNYANAKPDRPRPAPSAARETVSADAMRSAARPDSPAVRPSGMDRGFDSAGSRPAAASGERRGGGAGGGGSALAGAGLGGNADRAASQRGRQSMAQRPAAGGQAATQRKKR